MHVSFNNTTASTWTLATPSTTWESVPYHYHHLRLVYNTSLSYHSLTWHVFVTVVLYLARKEIGHCWPKQSCNSCERCSRPKLRIFFKSSTPNIDSNLVARTPPCNPRPRSSSRKWSILGHKTGQSTVQWTKPVRASPTCSSQSLQRYWEGSTNSRYYPRTHLYRQHFRFVFFFFF